MKFGEILKLTQEQLKCKLAIELSRLGYIPESENGFLYAEGDIPVMLVAHIDTVHKEPVRTICYSSNGNIIMSPQGIGGDDRCGVYMIMEIVKRYKCHVLFCEDEEIGTVGARLFSRSGIYPDVNYIIELDRHGCDDAVFYDCDNSAFTQFVCNFGFKKNWGTFSDISVIAPALKTAAVNISAGFFNEHHKHEHINFEYVNRNIELVSNMVATKTGKFQYVECAYVSTSMRVVKPYLNNDNWGWDSLCLSLNPELKRKSNINTKEFFVEPLMRIPSNYYIQTMDGILIKNNGNFYIDGDGWVYEYDILARIAYFCPNITAVSIQLDDLKFDETKAKIMEICFSWTDLI